MEFNKSVFAVRAKLRLCQWKGIGLLFIFLVTRTSDADAQFISSINAMIDQIGALGAYKQLLSDGYKIEETGVDAIKTIKGAEFGLHTTFFASLKAVNPQVSGYINQTGVIATLQRFGSDLNGFSSMVNSSAFLSQTEKLELQGIISSYSTLCQEDGAMLNSLLSAGQTSMTDGERLGRLDPLVGSVNAQFRSLESLLDQTSSLIARRSDEQSDNLLLGSLY